MFASDIIQKKWRGVLIMDSKEKIDYMKYLHIAVIVIGTILMVVCGIHTNIWFDETYSVGMANQNLSTLISAGVADVHPLLYYFMIKLWSLIFGTSIISLRMFSVLGMVVLSLLGYTHIRKDFDEKTGFIYSILVNFLPAMLVYSSEIRMYSWAAVFVTLAGIYAYRAYEALWKRKEKPNSKDERKPLLKNVLLFIVFSVASAYIHYFGLISICVINVFLLAAIVRAKKSEITWIISGAIQFLLYLPGMIVFLKQAFRVSKGFWISIKYPDIFKDILVFNYTGNLEDIWKTGIFVFATIVFAYSMYRIVKYFIYKKKNGSDLKMNLAILAFAVYIAVIAIALLASIITPIFTTRYTIPMIGLLIVFLAYIFGTEKYKVLKMILGLAIMILYIANFMVFYSENYNKNNLDAETYINALVKEGDIFVYSDMGVGGIVAVKYPENVQYFYNRYSWSVEEAYEAYAPQMTTVRDLSDIENYSGRIWIIDIPSRELTNEILDMQKVTKLQDTKEFSMKYKNITMEVTLCNKGGF